MSRPPKPGNRFRFRVHVRVVRASERARRSCEGARGVPPYRWALGLQKILLLSARFRSFCVSRLVMLHVSVWLKMVFFGRSCAQARGFFAPRDWFENSFCSFLLTGTWVLRLFFYSFLPFCLFLLTGTWVLRALCWLAAAFLKGFVVFLMTGTWVLTVLSYFADRYMGFWSFVGFLLRHVGF